MSRGKSTTQGTQTEHKPLSYQQLCLIPTSDEYIIHACVYLHIHLHVHAFIHTSVYTYTYIYTNVYIHIHHVSIPLVEYLIGGNGLSLGRFMRSRDGKYLLQRRKPRMGDSFPVSLCWNIYWSKKYTYICKNIWIYLNGHLHIHEYVQL